MKMCIACRLADHESCRGGKVDCHCGCYDRVTKENRVFSAEQERIIEETRSEWKEVE